MAIFARGKKAKNKKPLAPKKNLFFRLENKDIINDYTDLKAGAYYNCNANGYKCLASCCLDNHMLLKKLNPRLYDDDSKCFAELNPSSDRKHPDPREDPSMRDFWGKLDYNERLPYIFGFKSMKALLTWFFVEEGMKLIQDVAVIGVYEITADNSKDEITHIHGQFQSIAHKDYIKKICDLPTTAKKYNS